MKDLLLCVYVAVKTLNLEISGCHLADYVEEFYLRACRTCSTCSTIIFPHSTNQIIVFWCRRCCCHRSKCGTGIGRLSFQLPVRGSRSLLQSVQRWRQFEDLVGEYDAGFSLTFEVEGHWLVSREVPCETEGRRPETVGGSGGMLPRKIFRT